jgi:hypothetical protein
LVNGALAEFRTLLAAFVCNSVCPAIAVVEDVVVDEDTEEIVAAVEGSVVDEVTEEVVAAVEDATGFWLAGVEFKLVLLFTPLPWYGYGSCVGALVTIVSNVLGSTVHPSVVSNFVSANL